MTAEPNNSATSDDDVGEAVDSGPNRSIGRNIGALLSSQLVTWTLTTALVWVVPRYLGAEAFGSLSIANSLWMIAGILASFGTSTLLTVEIARRRTAFRSLLANVIKLRLLLYAGIAPIVIALLLLGPYDRATREVGLLIGLGGVVTLVATALESALYGLQEMGHPARIRVIAKVFVTVTTIVVVLLGGRLIPVALVAGAGSIVTLWLLGRATRRCAAHLTTPSPLSGRMLVGASAAFFAAEATRVVYQQIDTVVMSVLVDSTAIGYYAAADVLFGSLLFVPVIVTTAMFPAIADLHERSPHEVPPLLARSFNTLLLVSVPIGLGTIVVAPSFVELLYGNGFDGTVPVLAVYGGVVILSSQTILLGRFALATGRARFWSTLMIAVTVMSIPLDIVLVPWTDRQFDNGAIGGALAYVVTESILIAVGLRKLGSGVLVAATRGRVVRCVLAGSAMLAAGWPFRDQFFVVPGAISVAAYAIMITLLRTLNDHEVSAVRSAAARVSPWHPRSTTPRADDPE